MKTPRQRIEIIAGAERRNNQRIKRYSDDIENSHNAKSNYRQRTWNYVETYPGELFGAPDPDAYQRMKEIKDSLPARHECYVRQRITRRGGAKLTKRH